MIKKCGQENFVVKSILGSKVFFVTKKIRFVIEKIESKMNLGADLGYQKKF